MPLRVGEVTLLNLTFDVQVVNVPLEEAIAHRLPVGEPQASSACATAGVQLKGTWAAHDTIALDAEGPWVRYRYSVYPRYYIDLRQGYAAYLGKFSSKSQYNLRRQRRVYFEKLGIAPSMAVARTPEEIEDFYRRARAVSTLTYQERLLNSGLPTRPDFVEQMRSAALEGRVWGFLLPGADGRDAAYMYCLAAGQDLVCKYIGYDPATAQLSPGSTLLLMAVEVLCEEQGVRFFDFEEGGAQYKKQFATGSESCCNILVIPNTAPNRWKLRAHWRLGSIVRSLGVMADRFGLRSTLRKLIRQRSTAS